MNQSFFTKQVLLSKAKAARHLIAFEFIYMIWFARLERINISDCLEIHSRIDDLIPFSQYFVLPYLAWFILVPTIVILALLRDETEYRRLEAELIAGMLFFLIFNTFLPTCLYLRPDAVSGTDLCSRLVAWLYETDTPTIVLPSMHVYNTLCVLGSVLRSGDKVVHGRSRRLFCMVLSVLIIASTMLLKQHSVIDVVSSGILYGLVVVLAPAFATQKQKQTETVLSDH